MFLKKNASQISLDEARVKKGGKVGLFSIGSLEKKIPFVLYPLLLSSDVVLSVCKTYDYPQKISVEIINEIKSLLQHENLKGVVFDIRIHDWNNAQYLRESRILSQSLQDICRDVEINSSIILSNGTLLIGNAVGDVPERMEARAVLRGEGPLDLTKFALEIGADFLVMTGKAHQRIEAKKNLRDKIILEDFSEVEKEIVQKIKFSSQKKGYIHHLAMDELHALRSELSSFRPGLGFCFIKKTGDWIDTGADTIEVYIPEGQEYSLEEAAFQKPFVISANPPTYQPFILDNFRRFFF